MDYRESSVQLDMFKDVPPKAAPAYSANTAETRSIAHSQRLVKEQAISTPSMARQSAIETVPPEPVGAISDAGEELVANRRNRQRKTLVWTDIEGLNDALRVKETTKGNVWPKPDYEKMIADGMAPLVAHIYKQVYDSIASKPVTKGAFTDDLLKSYISGVRRVERGLDAWSQDKVALSAWAMQGTRVAEAMQGKTVPVTDLASAPTLKQMIYPNGTINHNAELYAIGGNKVLGAIQPLYGEVKRAIKAIDAGWPSKREAWEVQGYKVIENPEMAVTPTPGGQKFVVTAGKYYLSIHENKQLAHAAAAEVKPVLLVGKRGFISSFAERSEAVEQAKILIRRTKPGASQEFEQGANVVMAERLGTARRMEGEDIGSERLMQEFGLRGVNFGNWMKTPSARAEAQLHLNHAFDAFHDLAEILNIPPRAIGLGGMLGLAIGAQGRGGAAAGHFVPGVNEINLTRTTGAGVLSHEYGHAIDHYFAQQAQLSSTDEPYLSFHARMPAVERVRKIQDGKWITEEKARFGQLRPEILNSFRSVVEVMSKRALTPEETKKRQELSLQRTEKNINGWLSSFAHDFKDMEAEFSILANRVRAGDYGGERVLVGQNTYMFPVVVEMRELYKSKHGRIYSLDQAKGLQANLDSLVFRNKQGQTEREAETARPSMVTTDYASRAAGLDQEKGGKPYWSTIPELFARGFDSYIADRLDAISAKNSYLSFGVRETPDVPIGEERKVINAAFATLVGELRVKDQELSPPALFSVADESKGGLSRKQIETEIERLTSQWKAIPEVVVVNTHNELPFNSPADADGAYYEKKVYVISDNIADLQQLQKVMAHECVLHHSLEEMLGNYGFAKLHHGIQSLKTKGDRTVTALADDIQSRYGELPPEIETKEIVARAGEQCLDDQGNIKVEYGFMKGVFAGVAGWIRDHGISVPFTNIELQGILHKGGEWAKNPPNLETGLTKTVADKVKALSGLFIGKIIGIQDGVVTQKTGRGNETVLHSMRNLSKRVSLGDLAEIMYRGEKAEVKVHVQSHDLGR